MVLALLLPASLPGQDSGVVLRQAVTLLQSGRLADAETAIRSLLTDKPFHPDALVLLGFLQLRRNSLSQAQQTFESVLEKYRDFGPAQLGLGLVLRQQGQPEASGEFFRRLLNDPKLGHPARLQWIDSLYLQGRLPEAIAEARTAARWWPSDPRLLRLLGLIHNAGGQYEEAVAAFRLAIEHAPKSVENYQSLIELLMIRGEWDEVLHYTELALRQDPAHPLLFRNLALAQRARGLAAEAVLSESEADKLLTAETLYTQAVLARKSGRREEYEQLLIQCVRTNPRLSKAWSDIGAINLKAGRFEEAGRAYTMALEMDTESLPAHLGLAATFKSMGRRDEAVRVYRRAMDRGIASPDLYSGLAAIYLEQGMTALAASEILQARERWPEEADLFTWQGRILQKSADGESASRSNEVAVQPKSGRINAGIPNTESASNSARIRDALSSYEQATTLQPRSEAAWLGLIEAFGKAGHPEKAESACRSCLKWNPQSADCQEQLARIRMESGDFGEAIRLYEGLRASRRGSKSVLDGLGYAYVQSGHWDKARIRIEESLRRFGPEAGTLRQLGFIERSLGKVDQAAVRYRQAAELAPQDLDLRHDLAFTLYLQGEHRKAVGYLLSCLQARPSWGMAHYNLSLNYWHLRDYAAALRHARIAKDLGIIQAAGVEQALMPHLLMGKSRTAWIVRRK